jgi:hypothetical protein
MMSPKRLSISFALILWLASEILLFRFSRTGVPQYAIMLFVVPIALAGLLFVTWRFEARFQLTSWEIFRAGLWSKLISFHWYVIPVVYNFRQRDEWLLEIGHQVLTLMVQFAVIVLLRYMFHRRLSKQET